MLIGKNKKSSNKLEYFKGKIDLDIKVAADLLYDVINHSYQCSGNCLEIETNGSRKSLSNLFLECKEKIEQLEKGGQKVVFLSMSILEDTFKKCLPLLLVPVEEIAAGDMSQIEAVQKLRRLFVENPYASMWKEKSESYRKVIESLGFDVKVSDYQDLTAITEPLLDALTIYNGGCHYSLPKIKKVRSGKISKSRPDIMKDVCIFHSEKEFVDAVMGCGRENVVAFGGIAPLNCMIDNDMYEKINNRFNERKRNYMEHDGLTSEEYDSSICEYKRYIVLGVKSADTMWIMHMPYHTSTYANFSDPDSMYTYGKRAGYAPYQVFFKEPPAAEKDSTFLAISRRGYRLSEIMDEMQKIWLPVFLEETVERFFKNEPEAENVYLPEEIVARHSECEIVPVWTSLPVEARLVFDIPEPENVFDVVKDRNTLTLIHHFGINVSSIKDYPVLPKEIGTRDELERQFLINSRQAYKNEIKLCVKGIYERDVVFLREWVDKFVRAHSGFIIEATKNGACDNFTETFIDGCEAMLDDRYGRKEKVVWHPSVNDYQKREWDKKNGHYIEWFGKRTNKPGVIIKVRPKSASDYEVLFNRKQQELPELIRFYDEFSEYLGKQQYLSINICMSKRTYKNDFTN